MYSNSPVKSQYDLIQEHYYPNVWKMMICCMLLNQTTRKQVDLIIDEFFDKYGTPLIASKADEYEMAEIIKSLGFKNRRAKSIIKMSHQYYFTTWHKVNELHGLGKYAQDCYDLFINRKVNNDITDVALLNYVKHLELCPLEHPNLST